MHLPCSVFSRKQLNLFLWLLQVNNVDDVASTKSLKTLNKMLQNTCSINTLAYEGKLGHRYHVNNMVQILAQVNFCLVIVCKSSEIWLKNLAIQKFNQIFIFTLKIPANSLAKGNKQSNGWRNLTRRNNSDGPHPWRQLLHLWAGPPQRPFHVYPSVLVHQGWHSFCLSMEDGDLSHWWHWGLGSGSKEAMLKMLAIFYKMSAGVCHETTVLLLQVLEATPTWIPPMIQLLPQ